MNVPKELYVDWLAGLDSGMNNKTARKSAVDNWNGDNPDNQLTPAEVGIVCHGGDPVDDRGQAAFDAALPAPSIDPNDPPDGEPLAEMVKRPDYLDKMTKKELVEMITGRYGIVFPKSCETKKQMLEYLDELAVKCGVGGTTGDSSDDKEPPQPQPLPIDPNDMTKAMLVEWAKKEHGIDVPKSCKNKNQIIEYISKKISESAEAELETREDSDA